MKNDVLIKHKNIIYTQALEGILRQLKLRKQHLSQENLHSVVVNEEDTLVALELFPHFNYINYFYKCLETNKQNSSIFYISKQVEA